MRLKVGMVNVAIALHLHRTLRHLQHFRRANFRPDSAIAQWVRLVGVGSRRPRPVAMTSVCPLGDALPRSGRTQSIPYLFAPLHTPPLSTGLTAHCWPELASGVVRRGGVAAPGTDHSSAATSDTAEPSRRLLRTTIDS